MSVFDLLDLTAVNCVCGEPAFPTPPFEDWAAERGWEYAVGCSGRCCPRIAHGKTLKEAVAVWNRWQHESKYSKWNRWQHWSVLRPHNAKFTGGGAQD
jgi:hypothetical protein